MSYKFFSSQEVEVVYKKPFSILIELQEKTMDHRLSIYSTLSLPRLAKGNQGYRGFFYHSSGKAISAK